jgi:hypothetical protein
VRSSPTAARPVAAASWYRLAVDRDEEESVTSLAVAGERRIVLRRAGEADALVVVEPDGKVAVTVKITRDAVSLSIGGADLEVAVEGGLSIEAQSIALHGREGVAITTAGPLVTSGRSQKLTATRGDVAVEANDDVKLNGERIRLNC